MNRSAVIIATTPGREPLRRTLGEICTLLTNARGSDSAAISCMLLDAGKPVTLTVCGAAVTFTPEA